MSWSQNIFSQSDFQQDDFQCPVVLCIDTPMSQQPMKLVFPYGAAVHHFRSPNSCLTTCTTVGVVNIIRLYPSENMTMGQD